MKESNIHPGVRIKAKFGRTKRIIGNCVNDKIQLYKPHNQETYELPREAIIKYWEIDER